MKISTTNYYTLLLVAALFLVHSSFTNIVSDGKSDFKKIEYQILPTSILEVNGKTNINSFCCSSKERFQNKNLSYKFEKQSSSIHFQDTKFSIKIKQLDCGKKIINKDLFKALKANDYPNITIDFKEVFNLECNDLSDCDKWVEFEANADITITCETLSIRIPILVKKLNTESFRIAGGTTLQLCDFDIKAPTAMMGLIQVQDAIDFNFDLYVKL